MVNHISSKNIFIFYYVLYLNKYIININEFLKQKKSEICWCHFVLKNVLIFKMRKQTLIIDENKKKELLKELDKQFLLVRLQCYRKTLEIL